MCARIRISERRCRRPQRKQPADHGSVKRVSYAERNDVSVDLFPQFFFVGGSPTDHVVARRKEAGVGWRVPLGGALRDKTWITQVSGKTQTSSRQEMFAKLFSESRSALRRYVRRFVRSQETAEEIVQEAYLRTFRRADMVETPRAFLFSTARNLAVDEYRHERAGQVDSVGDVSDREVVSGYGPSSCASPEDALLADERTQLLAQAVAHLPPQCRAAFALRVFHGCSYREIGARLGIAAKTVERHVARGLRDTHAYMKRRYREGSAGDAGAQAPRKARGVGGRAGKEEADKDHD